MISGDQSKERGGWPLRLLSPVPGELAGGFPHLHNGQGWPHLSPGLTARINEVMYLQAPSVAFLWICRLVGGPSRGRPEQGAAVLTSL